MRPPPNRAVPVRPATGARGVAARPCGEEEAARACYAGVLVSDLDEVVGRLGAAGQDVTWDADFPGFRRVYAHDPFGNRLEFLQPA